MAKIEIYTQPWCPYCERAVDLLQKKGAEFQEIDAPNGTPERADAVRRSGGRTSVPQIFIDDRHIGGCDDLMSLERTKSLDGILTA